MSRRKSYKLSLPQVVGALVILLGALLGGRAALPESNTQTGYAAHFIDVGQGDSELLQLGSDYVLIDAGPTDAGDKVVSYLKQQGVTRLRAIIATHPHEDHIGGMAAVLAAFPVDSFYMPNKTTNTKVFSKMLDGIEKQGIKPTIPTPGDKLTVSGVTLTFLSPKPKASFDNLNNYSLVAMVDTGSERALFAGDAEKEIESALLAQKIDLSCDLYKVSHHGSSTSSTAAFLKAMSPRIAVISCGKDNSYGHPHKSVLTRLSQAGVEKIYNTAESGTVVLPLSPPSGSASSPKENAA